MSGRLPGRSALLPLPQFLSVKGRAMATGTRKSGAAGPNVLVSGARLPELGGIATQQDR